MKISQKGFISSLFLALIAVFVIGGGAYVYVQKNQTNQQAVVSQVNQPVPVSPITQATSTIQTSDSQLAISNFEYKQIVQQKTGTIQTGDTIKFTWSGCKLPKSDISLQLIYPSLGTGSEGVDQPKSILIADTIQNTQEYQWKIPPSIETGEYGVYIATNVCHSSASSKNTIKIQQTIKPFVIFTAPKASESVQSGTTYKILWTSDSDPNISIDIGYRSSLIGSQNYIHWITKNIKNVKNTGSYSWEVPANIAKFGWAQIIILNTKTSEQVASDAFLIN